MLRAKNCQSRPMFRGVIQKIKVARFSLRHVVSDSDWRTQVTIGT